MTDILFTGIDEVEKQKDHVVFHCGTAVKDEMLVTNGGRVLIAVCLDQKLTIAAAKATQACETISFDGKQYRRDIAHKGIAK